MAPARDVAAQPVEEPAHRQAIVPAAKYVAGGTTTEDRRPSNSGASAAPLTRRPRPSIGKSQANRHDAAVCRWCDRRRAVGAWSGTRLPRGPQRAARPGPDHTDEAAPDPSPHRREARRPLAGHRRRRHDDHRRRAARAPRPRRSRSDRSRRWARFGSASAPTSASPRDQRASCRSRSSTQLEFGGWDIFPDDAYESADARRACSSRDHLDAVRDELRAIKPMTRRLLSRVREAPARHARQDGADARPTWSSSSAPTSARFMRRASGCDRAVAVWCGSTEVLHRSRRRPRSRSPRSKRGLAQERSGDLELADLRVGVPEGARPLRQRRAEPLRRLPRRVGARARARASRSPAKTSRPGRR